MKPVRLEMQAFGPFAKKEIIDFSLLGTAPFFMINGPTGAGKSSILDAICFALFNETTGSDRSGDQMRCDFASQDIMTYVTFEFELGSVRYEISRSPEQWLPKKRGSGLTRQTHKATFYEMKNDEPVLISNRPKDIEKEVQNRIGLNVKQFRQVMVIPQGKFRELLLAGSKDREQILGQLFETHMYLDIERILMDKASDIRKQKGAFDQQIFGQLEVAGVSDEDELVKKKDDLMSLRSEKQVLLRGKQNEHEVLKADFIARQALLERFQKVTEVRKQLSDHKEQQETITAKQTQLTQTMDANRIAHHYSDYLKLNKQLAELGKETERAGQDAQDAKVRLTRLRASVAELEKQQKSLPEWRDALYRLKMQKEQLEAMQQLTMSVSEQNKQLQSVRTEKETIERQIQCAQDEIKHLEKEIDRQTREKERLPVIRHEIKELTEYQAWFDEQRKRRRAIEQLQRELKAGQAQSHRLKQEVMTADNTALKTELAWVKNQAAELASHLQESVPCPVCGSTEHPQPAEFSGEIVTKDQVDLTRWQWMEKQNALSATENNITDIGRRLESESERLAEIEKTLSLVDTLPEPDSLTGLIRVRQQELSQMESMDMAPLMARLSSLQVDLERLTQSYSDRQTETEKVQKELTILEGKIAVYRKESGTAESFGQVMTQIQELDQKINHVESQTVSLQQQREVAEKQYSVLDSALANLKTRYQLQEQSCWQAHENWNRVLLTSDFQTTDAFLAARQEQGKVELLQQEIKEYENRLLSLKTTLQDLDNELTGQELPDIGYWQKQLDAKQNEVREANDDFMRVNSEKERLEKVQEGIRLLKKKNEALEKEYQVLGTLSDVANGKNSARISLHRFVLGVLLDDILIQASHRLRTMTQGRYLLYRKTDRNKGNASSGLELIVEDSYTGKSRDVATLSGGESFMAALALALGLSDVVQSYSGGIRLDTLFVDEGFGSLDSEALDLAIQVLLELQRSGRTIGIISHVNELKEQIGCRIDVIPSTTGSHIRIIN
ncbi:AAA family ATPase [Vibrio salinus]|uniref:AAA family ATPase n=1 Tax=Vibrio salinus TaxID=2899784 RepID=UPI001E2F34C8|nr:SMC family ATPase [Vibrio salinus]MCE0495405.1 SMC family ATPase [Vibrio salinus]